MTEDTEFPQFDIKMQAHARSHFRIDKSEVGALSEFLLAKKWKGKLEVVFPGNGGITQVTFDEVRPMSATEEKT